VNKGDITVSLLIWYAATSNHFSHGLIVLGRSNIFVSLVGLAFATVWSSSLRLPPVQDIGPTISWRNRKSAAPRFLPTLNTAGTLELGPLSLENNGVEMGNKDVCDVDGIKGVAFVSQPLRVRIEETTFVSH
jgi:hypothetical protein